MKKTSAILTLVFSLMAFGIGSVNAANIEDKFLDALRIERVPVSIYLVNGIKLQGQIENFSDEVILLKNAVTQMIYINAISTVVPARNTQTEEPMY